MTVIEDNDYDFLSRESFYAAKGYLAVLVLISHLYQFSMIMAETYVGQALYLLGHYTVIGFMFISGYGICASYDAKREQYIRGFFKRRFLPLFLEYTFAVVCYYTFEAYIGTGKPSVLAVIKSFSFGSTIVSFGWFLQYMLWAYIVFLIIYSLKISDRVKLILLFATGIAYIIGVSFVNGYIARYTAIMSFAFGFLAYYLREKITRLIKSFGVFVFLIGIVLLAASYKAGVIKEFGIPIKIIASLIGDVALILVMLTLLYVINKKTPSLLHNFVAHYLSDISLEVYLVQAMVLRALVYWVINPYLYVLVAAVSVFVMAIPIHYLMKAMLRPLKK